MIIGDCQTGLFFQTGRNSNISTSTVQRRLENRSIKVSELRMAAELLICSLQETAKRGAAQSWLFNEDIKNHSIKVSGLR